MVKHGETNQSQSWIDSSLYIHRFMTVSPTYLEGPGMKCNEDRMIGWFKACIPVHHAPVDSRT